jgi:hypothetical protein
MQGMLSDSTDARKPSQQRESTQRGQKKSFAASEVFEAHSFSFSVEPNTKPKNRA